MAEWLTETQTANKCLSGTHVAKPPISADQQPHLRQDRTPQRISTSIGADFSQTCVTEGAQGGSLSPMTAHSAPAAGVAQMKKGGGGDGNVNLYAGSRSARQKNRKFASKENDKQQAIYDRAQEFVNMQTGPMIRLDELNTQKRKTGTTPEMEAEVAALLQRLEGIKAQRDAEADTHMVKFDSLGWGGQDTSEKLQDNYANIQMGASAFNPFLMTDQHISQNYLYEQAESDMYHGLMTDLQGADGISKDKGLRGTLAGLKEGSGNDFTDISNYSAIMRNRFERIQDTGSSQGWEEEFMKDQTGREGGQAELDSLARMRAQAKERLSEKGGRKRWMKE